MPTIVTKTIKASGGDYGSAAAWEAGQNGNLVANDQIQEAVCYGMLDDNGFSGPVDIAGGTTDATRYMWVHAATGAEAQMPYDSTGTAYRLESAGFNGVLAVHQDYTRVERIQVKAYADDNNIQTILIGSAPAAVRIVGCTITNTPPPTFGTGVYGVFVGTDSTGDRYLVNNFIVIDSRAGASSVYGIFTNNHLSGATYAYNNTVICPGVNTSGNGALDGFGDLVLKNNVFKGWAGGSYASITAGNCTTNASGDVATACLFP